MSAVAAAQTFGPVQVPAPGHSLGLASGTQNLVDLAAYDGGALAVWQDTRRSRHFVELYAARIDNAGNVLDPRGIAAGTYGYDDWSPAVGCGRSVCLAVWSTDEDMRAIRIGFDGSLLDAAPLTLSTRSAMQLPASVTFDGAVFRVAWREDGNVATVDVSESGTVEGLLLRAVSSDLVALSTTWAQDRYAVAWASPSGAFTTQLFADGGMSSPTRVGPADAVKIALAHDGVSGVVAWQRSNDPAEVYASPLDAQVSPTDLPVVVHDVARGVRGYGGGASSLLLYPRETGGPDLWTATLDAGALVPREATSDHDGRTEPALATHHVAYQKKNAGGADLFAMRWAGGAAVPGSEVWLTKTGEAQIDVRMAASPEGAMVVYERATDRTEVEVVALGLNGEPLGPPREVTGTNADATGADVTFDGTSYVVSWVQADALWVRAFGLDGSLQGAALRIQPLAAGKPSLAGGAGARLLCFQTGTGFAIRAFDFNGFTGVPYLAPSSNGRCAAAWSSGNDGGFIVGYQESSQVHYVLMAPDGRVRGSTRQLPEANDLGFESHDLTVAGSPSGFLVVWRPELTQTLLATRIALDGGQLDAPPLVVFDRAELGVQGQTEGRFASATFDGTDYVVAWDTTTLDGGADVYSRRVGLDGALSALGLLASGPVDQEVPALASTGDGRVTVAWSEWEPPPGSDSLRLRARVVTWRDGGAPVLDAGVVVDAGTTSPDGGTTVAPPALERKLNVQCGCGALSGAGPPLLLLAHSLARARSRDRAVTWRRPQV
ncbi:MAG: hypothetical protein JNK82_02685 [Myxococcaceae bacterium]|nr:hypothetical protein [Myxococcaceae bacterium]